MVEQLLPIAARQVDGAKGVIRHVWREHFGAHANPDVRAFLDRPEAFPDLDWWGQTYAAPRGLFLVVLDGERVVGTGGIRPVDEQVAELTRMFLLQEYRGRGLGRRSGERPIQFARGAGYRSIRLGTNKQLVSSHALYRSLGFRDIPAYEPDGEKMAYYMAMSL